MIKIKQTLFFTFLGLGLTYQQTSNETQTMIELIQSFTNFANSLNGTTLPYEAAEQIIPAISKFQEYVYDIALVNFIPQYNIDQSLINSMLEAINAAYQRSYPITNQQTPSIFNSLDQPECYTKYSEGDIMIYYGFNNYIKFATGEDSSGSEFASFCVSEPNFSHILDDFIGLIEGTGECDILAALFSGEPKSNIYTGWTDFKVDRSSYLVMYATLGIAMQTTCNYLNTSLDQSKIKDMNGKYTNQLVRMISRILEFNALAQQSVSQSLTLTLIQIMVDNPNLSLDTFTNGFNGFDLYSDLLLTIGLTYSSADERDFYSECWNCINVTLGRYRAVLTWLSFNTTTSLSSDLNLQQYLTENRNPQDIASAIRKNVGDCVSGVWIFNQSTPHSIESAFEDRIVSYQGEIYDIYVWGVQEDCLGRQSFRQSLY
ncbi:UNKNOWN [Stylonychia lemnae]|uniref:Uncharacterized protein n=1 Tax=Stylonychia lemnae TaxID=5949 RepID=A0A077ZPP6_STYLE|nr:UNKNOWN [Stylonychia lemnae]|eukprot:CDW71937.1 UNKNOWN [Stylonychia lemnae]